MSDKRPTFTARIKKGGLKVINEGKGNKQKPEPKQTDEGKADAYKS